MNTGLYADFEVDDSGDVIPPWKKFPGVPLNSIQWRMGSGEAYWIEFAEWFESLGPKHCASYIQKYPKPDSWKVFWPYEEFATLNAVQGAIVGSAIGDAMGCPSEFLNKNQIYNQYGPDGISGYVLYREKNGIRFAPYTDDTQMAEAVIRSLLEQSAELETTMERMASHFIEWSKNPLGGHRAPGRACLDGCRRLDQGVHWSEAGGRKAGGCGSVMRAYPFGIFFRENIEKAEEWAVSHSRLTHNDPIALAACAAMAAAMSLALKKHPVQEIIESMYKAAMRYSRETAYMINNVKDRPLSDQNNVLAWYEGWAAHEAIAATAYLFSHYHSQPRQAILAAANSPGDSDSLGAMIGALTGAYCGLSEFPDDWIDDLERSEELLALSKKVAMDRMDDWIHSSLRVADNK